MEPKWTLMPCRDETGKKQRAANRLDFRFCSVLKRNEKTTNLASGRGVVWFRRIFCQCRDTPLNIRRRRYWRPWRPGFGTLAVPKWTNLNLQKHQSLPVDRAVRNTGTYTHRQIARCARGIITRIFSSFAEWCNLAKIVLRDNVYKNGSHQSQSAKIGVYPLHTLSYYRTRAFY